MAEIVPAVLADTSQQYRHDLEIAVALNDRVQLDLVDGEFANHATINLVQTYWPEQVRADMHLMYNDPFSHLFTIISQQPHLAIIHMEARQADPGAIRDMSIQLRETGIKFGLALLPETKAATIEPYAAYTDHVLVFTGELGHYGGHLRSDCLEKIGQLKRINQEIEVGVDGGITDETAAEVVAAGADVLNVGGFIQHATHPETAYAKLEEIIGR